MSVAETCPICFANDILLDGQYGKMCSACRECVRKAKNLPPHVIKSARLVDTDCEQCHEDVTVWMLGNGLKICELCMTAMRLVLGKEGKHTDNG